MVQRNLEVGVKMKEQMLRNKMLWKSHIASPSLNEWVEKCVPPVKLHV